MTIIYASALVFMIAMLALLAVDYGRAMSVKNELQTAVDAASRNAAGYLDDTQPTLLAQAKATAQANTVAGSAVVLSDSDIQIGTWNSSTSTFTVAAIGSANAVRVTATRGPATGNGVPLVFGSLTGASQATISASSVAVFDTGGAISNVRVDGIMNLWLAGMPNGNYGGSANTGTAPTNSPRQVSGLTLTAGQELQFNAVGSTADDPANINQNWSPDGDPLGLRTNTTGYLHGMSQMPGRQASLIGVFLDNNAPNTGGTPAQLNFNTQAERDYTTISPLLKQVFFIGDGKTSGGVQQKVVVPSGATRLFLGTHDNVNWANNSGYYQVTINGSSAKIKRVK